MVALTSLWLPIALSAVFVFVVSSVIHMATPWHKSDNKRTPDEDKVMEALRPFAVPPGDYMMPRPERAADLKSPEFNAKMERGPVMVFTVLPNGKMNMGKSLILWFAYSVVISTFAAFLCIHTAGVGATYHRVFGVAAVAAFLGYAGALWQSSIWYARSWTTTLKSTIDGLIYAGLTAGTLGWLWPR